MTAPTADEKKLIEEGRASLAKDGTLPSGLMFVGGEVKIAPKDANADERDAAKQQTADNSKN